MSVEVQPIRHRTPWRILVVAALLLLAALTTCIIFWRPIAIEIMRNFALAEFRAEFARGGDDVHMLKADSDWVFTFGGSRSLTELRRMSTDPTLDKHGQRLAAQLVTYIESGEHVRWCKVELDLKVWEGNWFRRKLTEYIFKRDQAKFGDKAAL